MSRHFYGNNVIDNLTTGRWTTDDVIHWLRVNLTDAALAGCHHCGEAERADAPCWWCGLRNQPKIMQMRKRKVLR